MQLDLMAFIEHAVQTPWAQVVGVLLVVSFFWYYLRHTHRVIVDETARTPWSLFKNFLVGQPLQLLGILVFVIAVVALFFWVFDVGLVE